MTDMMRRTKLPIEIIVMVLSELTHAEAWRLRILCCAVNDWVHNVLVKRALQSTALVARAPASFIFYEPTDGVHGLRFSFLQKHGTSAIFQAKIGDTRERESFHQKSYLHIVVHLANNDDPIFIRHLKIRDLSLDRDSMTLQCNWRNLIVAAFSMSPQQRSNQALSITPKYVWQPAKIDGMSGKWRKGLEWLYTESQVSSASQRSASTTSSSQHMYGLVAYESASGTTSSNSQESAGTRGTQFSSRSNLTQQSNLTQITHISASSLFSTSQLSQINDVPQSSPPRAGMMHEDTALGMSMLHSISAYQDSSCSSRSRPSGSAGPSVLRTLGLDGTRLNPAPAIDDPPTGPSAPTTYLVQRFTFAVGPESASSPPAVAHSPPLVSERSPPAVPSSPISESLLHTQSATIRPAMRGGGSSPLGVLEEEVREEPEGEEEDEGTSWMVESEHDVSRMLVAEDETQFEGDDEDGADGDADDEREDGYGWGHLGRTDSKSSMPESQTGSQGTTLESQGTTLGGTDAGSVGYALSQAPSMGGSERLSQTYSVSTTDVESEVAVDEKGRTLKLKLSEEGVALAGTGSPRLGGVHSMPLPAVSREVQVQARMSAEALEVRRDVTVEVGSRILMPSSSIIAPSEAEGEPDAGED